MFKILDGREKFYQWDTNRKLVIEDSSITEVHFCNRTDNCSLVCEVYTEDGARLVNVPNILLQNDWRIFVYAFDNEYTKYEKCFNVVARTRPADYVYTETEVRTWETLSQQISEEIQELNSLEYTVNDNEMNRWAAEENRELAEENRQATYNKLVKRTEAVLTNLEENSENFSNALKGYATGAAVALKDISPVTHEISIKVTGATKLIKQGKNLFDIGRMELVPPPTTSYCKITTIGEDYLEITTPANYSGNGYCNSGNKLGTLCPSLKEGMKATLSFVVDKNQNNYFYFSSAGVWRNGESKLITKEILNDNIIMYGSTTDNAVIRISNIQVEIGTATEYEAFVEPVEYEVNADGAATGVYSIYPSTTLLTDTQGAIISATYNKDLNKAFAELYNAIISIGGNI